MPYYVYVLQSLKDQSFYKGFSEDYEQRPAQHNAGLSAYTSQKTPWKLVHVEIHESKV
jgi:putative endonuclease